MIQAAIEQQKESTSQIKGMMADMERRISGEIQSIHIDVKSLEGAYADLRERFGRVEERNENQTMKIIDMQKDVDRAHGKGREALNEAQAVKESNIRINVIISAILAFTMVCFAAYVNYEFRQIPQIKAVP